jgi:hypothetical protein
MALIIQDLIPLDECESNNLKMRFYIFIIFLSICFLSCNRHEIYTFECSSSTETVTFIPPKYCYKLIIELLEVNEDYGTLILSRGKVFEKIKLGDYKSSEFIFDEDWYGDELGIKYEKNQSEPDCEGSVKLKIMFFGL